MRSKSNMLFVWMVLVLGCERRDGVETARRHPVSEPAGYEAAYAWYLGRAEVSLMALKALEAGDTNTVRTVLELETTMTAWMLPVYEREVNISEKDREAGRVYARRVLDYLETAISEKRIAGQPAEHALRGLDSLLDAPTAMRTIQGLRAQLASLPDDMPVPYSSPDPRSPMINASSIAVATTTKQESSNNGPSVQMTRDVQQSENNHRAGSLAAQP